MLDTGEPIHIHTADMPEETASRQNPLMAPELAPLRDAGLPLNPHSLPNFTWTGDKVVINISTTESANSPKYQSAIRSLEAQGCTVTIDRESALNFTYIQIIAPESLFSPEAIAALEENQIAKIITCERASHAGRAIQASSMPDWGC